MRPPDQISRTDPAESRRLRLPKRRISVPSRCCDNRVDATALLGVPADCSRTPRRTRRHRPALTGAIECASAGSMTAASLTTLTTRPISTPRCRGARPLHHRLMIRPGQMKYAPSPREYTCSSCISSAAVIVQRLSLRTASSTALR